MPLITQTKVPEAMVDMGPVPYQGGVVAESATKMAKKWWESVEGMTAASLKRKAIAATMPDWVMDHIIQSEYDLEDLRRTQVRHMKSWSHAYKCLALQKIDYEFRKNNWLDRPAKDARRKMVADLHEGVIDDRD